MWLLLCATVAADLVLYDPSKVLTGSEPTTTTCAEVGAWAERLGAPGAFGESLPFTDMLNPPDVAIFVAEGPSGSGIKLTGNPKDLNGIHVKSVDEAHALAREFTGVAAVATVRRLADDDDIEESYYDIEEISQFQLNMWAGIVLVLMVAGAVYALATMNPEYDSLLYATFQANVASSKLD